MMQVDQADGPNAMIATDGLPDSRTERACRREVRVVWYGQKIGYLVRRSLELATGKPVNLARTLSVGCGAGEDVEILQNLGAHPVGVDIDKENIPFWRTRKLDCILADASKLPFRASLFDWVLGIEVIEHIGQESKSRRESERQKFATELTRVCAKGGAIFLSTPNKRFPLDIAHARMDKRMVGGLHVAGLRLHSPWESFTLSLEEMKEMFGTERMQLSSPLEYVNWTWYFFTRNLLVRHLGVPVAKLWVRVLDRLSCLRGSFLDPHLIVIVRVD